MKKTGIALIALGFYCVLFAFNMDVVVGTTYNIGLMNERQNVVYLSGIIFLAGIILFGFGFSAKEESKNLKTFVMSCFLLPILLLVGIKTIVSVQESEKQKNIRRQAAIDAQEYKEKEKEEQAKWEVIKKEEQAEQQKREIELSAHKEIAKKVLEGYANEFANNKTNRNFNASENLVRAAIITNFVDASYTDSNHISGIEIKDSSDFSVAIYTLNARGSSNSYKIDMVGFMKGKIIKPINVGHYGGFFYNTIGIKNRIIELDGVTVGDNDGWCCPSKPMTKKFEISENGFREITTKQ